MTREQKYKAFKALHERDGIFIIPNPWNAGTAKILTALGFEALATTSAGYAFSIGRQDSNSQVTRDGIARERQRDRRRNSSAGLRRYAGRLRPIARKLLRDDSARLRHRPRRRIHRRRNRRPGIPHLRLPARRRAHRSRRRNSPHPSVPPHRKSRKFPPRPAQPRRHHPPPPVLCRRRRRRPLRTRPLHASKSIREVCASVSKPVNVLMGFQGATFSVEELAAAGAKRISVGGSLARAALGAFIRAAREIKDKGTFTYSTDAISHADANAFMTGPKTKLCRCCRSLLSFLLSPFASFFVVTLRLFFVVILRLFFCCHPSPQAEDLLLPLPLPLLLPLQLPLPLSLQVLAVILSEVEEPALSSPKGPRRTQPTPTA